VRRLRAARRCTFAELRPVRLRIPDPSLREELSGHYVRSGFGVRPIGEQELEVERPDAPDEQQGRREVGTHLLVWELLHPECPCEIVG
jgi:hypothetical protein